MNHHYCDKCGQPVRKTAKRKTAHTQQKRKKRNYAPVVFLAGLAALIVALMYVMIAGAAGDADCMAGSSWVRITLHQEAPTPQIYGWVAFTNKCGETYLIPIDPRVFVADVSQGRCLEDACQDDPRPWLGDER